MTLPNQKSYQFKYNRYAELVKVELPAGGRFEYDWGSGYVSGHPSGTNGSESWIIRRVLERREYSGSSTLAGKTTFGKRFAENSPVTEASVLVKSFTPNDQLLAQDKHYFKVNDTSIFGMFALPSQLDGREFKTELLALDGSVLRRTTHTWVTSGTVINTPKNPRITETVTTLNDANLVSKQTFLYDGFNNRTDTYEFDFGVGSAGARRRHSRTTYLNSASYTNVNVHLRNLVTQVSVFDGPDGAEKERSRIVYEYDDYSNTTNHAPLKNWQSVTGIPMTNHDATLGTSYTTRGNVTKATQFLLVADPTTNPAGVTGSVASFSQFDLAGNVVKTIDSLNNVSDIEYVDRFGNADGTAQSNTGPAHLNSPTQKYTYAFPTKVTNALGQIGFSQYDYYLGAPVDVEDINNVVATTWYGDLLDRPTQVISGNNQTLAVDKSRSTFTYDDTGRTITRKSDKDVYTDGLLTTQTVYDGLGRTTESRVFENATDFIATRTQYDALGRASATSSPFRENESLEWTTQVFDPLGRVILLTTPDNSVVTTSYSGNSTTVTDQAGKRKKSVTDALGHLVEVYEDPEVAGGPAELNYQTSYLYDTLDNLVKVTQGSQLRFFMYDSLKRMIRSRGPEHATLAALSLSDPITGNSSWSLGNQYDANGNVTQKTDPRGVVSTLVYDALNRNTTIDYSDTTSINPDVTRQYDGALKGKGRVWKSYAGGTESNGATVERTVVDSYDVFGRPLILNQSFKVNSVWKSPYQTSRTYNQAGAVTAQTYPSGHVVNYNYDDAGRLADNGAIPAFKGNLGDGGMRTYSKGITYASSGQLTQEQFGTATAVYNKLFYNKRQQLAEILVSTTVGNTWDRGKILNQYSLQCSGAGCDATDNNGNLRKQEVFIPNINPQIPASSWYQQFDYDELNRLKRVHEYTGTAAIDWQQEFDYDRWGNRTINATGTWIGAQGNPPSGLLNEKQFDTSVMASTNRLQAPGDESLAENLRRMRYDGAGNLTTDTYTGAGERVYDADNRMTKAWGGDNQWQFYTYDADGQRTRRKINNQETWHVYGFDGELLADYPADVAAVSPTKEYGYRNGQLLISAEAGVALAAPVFADDFNDNSLNTSFWTTYGPGSPTVTEQGQQLQIAIAPSTAGYNGVFSNATYDLTNKMVQVESAQSVSQAGWCENFLEVELNANNYFMIQVGAGNMLFRSRVNGVNDQTVIAFDGVANRHWRIRHDQAANQIHFETSSTGSVWLTRKSVTPGFALTSLRFHLLAGAYGTGNSSPGTAKYDNFKLLTSTTGSVSLTVPNGSFETPVIGNGNWQYAPSGATWSFANGGGITGMNSAFTGAPSAAPQGVQVAFLQATGEVSQSISGFQAGTDYLITFASIQRTNCCNTGGQDIGVYVDSTQIGTMHPGTAAYTEFSFPFTTTAGAHTIKFVGLNPLGGDHTAFIDNVRITGSPKPGYGVQWLVADQLGTPRMILDETGSLANVKRHDYLPFGEELLALGLRSSSMGYAVGDGVRQQFTAQERDLETGLDYFLARYYASVQGRFTSVDPLLASGSAGAPQTWNRYSYSYNNPLRYTDPSGMVAGDFYDIDGDKIGTDGTQDNKRYIVYDDNEAKTIKNTQGAYTGTVTKKIEIAHKDVVAGVDAALTRSNNATFAGSTPLTPTQRATGGFSEAGLTWNTDAAGNTTVTAAQNGPPSDPRVNTTATISLPSGTNGRAHIHPSGEIVDDPANRLGASPGATMGGTRTTYNFDQQPSQTDINNAGTGTNIVVGARNKNVYFYVSGTGNRSDCNCIAKMSLNAFRKVGK